MDAVEARAAWQRTANHCFVQEDAKRAPKLAFCPSSSKLQSDASNCDALNGLDQTSTSFMPPNWNPSNSSLPPDTKWWLQLQPNFACPMDFSHEQLNVLDVKLEGMKDGDIISTSKLNGDPPPCEDTQVDLNKNPYSTLDLHWRVSAASMKHDSKARVQELKAVNSNMQQPLKHKADMDEFWYADEKFMDWKPVNQSISDEKACFDLEMPWMESDKTEPWWRTADKDELTSLVAQKPLKHIENCDLPSPQIIHHSPASGSMDGKHRPSSEARYSFYDSDKMCTGTNSYGTTIKDSIESRHTTESIPSKAQLLEALRHSQTRAREAERVARQAYTEKEHVIKLFFRQASHLFAYKQWLQLLQLETLLLQLKMNDHQKISTLLQGLPWMPLNTKQLRKVVYKVIKRKGGHRKYSFSNYAVVVAVGLGLAGAGLLLGWTMGRLHPTF